MSRMDWPALKRLVQKQYDGLNIEIKDHFDELISGKLSQKEDQTAINNLHVCTLRFLTQCCSLLADDKALLDAELELAIESCCHGYSQLCRVAVVSDAKVLTSLKTLLYIVSKLVEKASPSTLITISYSVLETLKSVPVLEDKNQICDYIPRFYSFLWNAAITFERQAQIKPVEVCQLRVVSLRLLAQLNSRRESCLEKLVLALNVFEYQSKQRSGNTEKTGEDSSTLWKKRSVQKKSKSSKTGQEQKDSSPASEYGEWIGQCDSSERSLPEHHILFLVLEALEDILQDRQIPMTPLLKLVLCVYDILASSKLTQNFKDLETKVVTLMGKNVHDSFSEIVSHILEPAWDLIQVVEQLCEDSTHIELCGTDLTTWLGRTLNWCQQQHSRNTDATDAEKTFFVELFQWFGKQIKSRKLRTNFFTRPDLVMKLLHIFREAQSYFVENSAALACGGGDGDSLKQEWQEKVSKTHLDVHRCWLMLYHKAVTEHPLSLKTCFGENHLMIEAEDQLSAYPAAINMAAHFPSLEQSERYAVGSLCVRLGHLFYNQNLDETAIKYYQLACQQLILWCQANPHHFTARVKESTLIKLHNCLSQSLMKVGRLDDAMTTITQAMNLRDQETNEDLAMLMKTWIKLKKLAVREGGESLERWLARSLANEGKDGVDMVCHYLQLELNWLLRGPRLWAAEGAVLKRLYENSPAGKDRDLYHLLLLQFDVLTNHPLETDREEMKQCLHTITTTYPEDPVLQMEVCLIRFCLLVKDKVGKPVAEPSEDENTVGVPVIGNHEKMFGEEEKVLVRAALNLWTVATNTKGVDGIVDKTTEIQGRMTLDLLMMVADILLACREFLLQLEILMVMKQISQQSPWDGNTKQGVDTSILEALAGLGVEDLPDGMIDAKAGVDSSEAGLEEKGAETVCLSLVNFYLKAGKVEKAHPLLNILRDKELKGELGSLQRGKYNRLLSQCLMTMARDVSTEDYILPIIQNSYRAHFSLFSRTDSGEGSGYRSSSNQGTNHSLWLKVVELLESTFSLGRTLRHIGDSKRAKCYLKEGLTLSRKFGLLKWSTMFGVEVADLMLDIQSLQSMVSMLTATYTALSIVEPPASCSPHPIPPSKVRVTGKTKPLSTGLKLGPSTTKSCDFAPEDIVNKCQREYDDIRSQLWNEKQTGEHINRRFWQKVQTYAKMEEEKRMQLHENIVDLAAYILAWSSSLVKHPADCWCSVCSDAESQRLALTLTKTSIKLIHTSVTAEFHLERFFEVVLKHLKKVDPSKKVARILHSMGMVGQLDKVRCRDVSFMLCTTELCALLVESTLHRHHLPQALAHVTAGLRAASYLPQHCSDTWLIKSRLAHLQAVCVYHSLCIQQPQRKRDWRDTWCWLTEPQLEVQIRNKLDQLKIKGPPSIKGDKVSSGGDAQSSHSLFEKESIQDSKESPSEYKISPSENVQSSHSLSGTKHLQNSQESPNEQKLSLSKDMQSALCLSGKEIVKDSKESLGEYAESAYVFTDKDDCDDRGRKHSPNDSEESSHTGTDDNGKISRQSTNIGSSSHTDKQTAFSRSKMSTKSNRAAIQHLSSEMNNMASSKPNRSALKSTKASPASDGKFDNKTATERKGKETTSTMQRTTALMKEKSGEDRAVTSWRDSFENKTSPETDPVLFTEEAVVTQLFQEEPLADQREKYIMNKNEKCGLQTPLTTKTAEPSETPSSVIQQKLSSTRNLPDSGDEFQPTTPKSTPRTAGWWKRKPSEPKGDQDKTSSGRLKLSDVISSCRSDKRAGSSTRKGSSSYCNAPVESLEARFLQLAVSGGYDGPSTNLLPPKKTRQCSKSAKAGKKTSKTLSEADQDVVFVEALQQDLAKLDLSRETEDTTQGIQIIQVDPPKELSSAFVQNEIGTSQKGRRGHRKKLMETTNSENASIKTGTGKRRRGKGLSPVINIPLETVDENRESTCAQILPPVMKETTAVPDSSCGKREKTQRKVDAGKQTRKAKQAHLGKNPDMENEADMTATAGRKITSKEGRDKNPDTENEADVVMSTAGKTTTSRGGRKPREEKPVIKPSRGRRAAATRTSKNNVLVTATDPSVPEREVVRGVDDPPEPDSCRDVFEFMESDGETQPSQTSTRKGKRGRQTKTLTSVGRNTKPAALRTVSAKSTEKSIKSSSSKHRSVSHSTSVSSPKQTVAIANKDTTKHRDQHVDSKQPFCIALVDKKEASLTNTVSNLHTDHNSIETLRMGDLTSVLKSTQGKDNACSLPSKTDVHSSKENSEQSGFNQQKENVWHLENLLSHFQGDERYVNVSDDGDELLSSLLTDGTDTVSPEKRDKILHIVQAQLTESLSQIQHFPHVNLFSETSKLVAQIKLDQGGDPWEIAALLSESAAVSLRHQFLAYYHKHIRQLEMEGGDKQIHSVVELRATLQELLFPWDLPRYRKVVQSIPHGWTLCQFSVVDSPGSHTLLLTRLTCDQEPLTVELPHFSDEMGQSIYFGFKDILKVNEEVQKIKENALWWRHRATLETKLGNMLEGMEKHWLGLWKGMLTGQTSNSDYNEAMSAAAEKLVKILHSFLGCRWSVGRAKQALEILQHTRDLPTILSCLLQRDDVSDNTQLLNIITSKVLEVMPKITDPDLPVVLILDKHIANFPIEQLNVMRNQAVTRVPSLSLFHHLLKRHSSGNTQATGGARKKCEAGSPGKIESVMERGIDPTSVFYVLNPDGDLVKSQGFLETSFQSNEKWKGIAGAVPTKEQYEQALSQHDMFVYCGHGNGCKYFSMEELLKTKCRAVPLLFGCASVRLDVFPTLDADAYFYGFLLAGSPCVLGNLWDVTDRDIDAFGMEIFNLWLKENGKEPKLWLASLVQQARSTCRMKWLNGGAPVLYGLPVPLLRPLR